MKYVNAEQKLGLMRKLRECAYAPTVTSFNQKIEVLKLCSPAFVEEFLKDLDPKHWANAHFGGQTMEQMSKCRVKGNKWVDQLCPKMEKKLEAEYKPAGHGLRNIYDSIEPYYHVSEFKASYSESIHPIPTVEKPIATPTDYLIAPLVVKRPRGRPKRKRIPSRGGGGATYSVWTIWKDGQP
ncbi:hypothetical protein ACSBR2_022642 [Camellia fascicularis]